MTKIQQQLCELPSYGLRRDRETHLLRAINVIRVYQVMRDHNLLLDAGSNNPPRNVGTKAVLR